MSAMSQHIQEDILLILSVCLHNRQQNIWLKNLSHGSSCSIKMVDTNLKRELLQCNFSCDFVCNGKFLLHWK